MKRLTAILACVGFAVVLTAVFWPEFWRGYGLIGGDLYTYYFPQKVYYAERLAAGEFPLWNPLVGHGYPLIAESQTGAFYPPNYFAYQMFEVDLAYNLLQLAHYAAAFVFSFVLGRALGLSGFASALLGIVFVYGWFPAHITHEWAILSGAWMPAAVWAVEKLLTTGQWRYAGALAVVLALQMLPGHFHLAFMTQVLIACYAVARIWCRSPEDPQKVSSLRSPSAMGSRLSLLLGGVLLGFALAAVQLVPTLELKTLSQRSAVGTYYDPAYGHIPVWYWTQIVTPFLWYGSGADLNAALAPDSPPTNAVEAHLYFGMVPVLLVIYGLFTGVYWRDRRWMFWGAVGLLALFYATGWLLALTKPLPGFHFFRGLGRWGILTTLAVATLCGAALDSWMARRRSGKVAITIACVILLLTILDLRIVRGLVGDGVFVANPPIQQRDDSPIRRELQSFPQPVRLFCRGANLPTLLGVASTPTYLGIGPDEYFDPATTMPEPLPFDNAPTREQVTWLQHAGVTHVLSFAAVDESAWPVDLVWAGYDLLLSRSWARGPGEPLYLYRLKNSRGRVAWLTPAAHATNPVVENLSANRVVIRANADRKGTLVLTALNYPGWEVSIDGVPQESKIIEGMYRGVDVSEGEHVIEWAYRPRSQRIGYAVAGIAVLLMCSLMAIRFWRTRSTAR